MSETNPEISTTRASNETREGIFSKIGIIIKDIQKSISKALTWGKENILSRIFGEENVKALSKSTTNESPAPAEETNKIQPLKEKLKELSTSLTFLETTGKIDNATHTEIKESIEALKKNLEAPSPNIAEIEAKITEVQEKLTQISNNNASNQNSPETENNITNQAA